MNNWFGLKITADKKERSYGMQLRLAGIDFFVLLLGWINDWVICDIRLPAGKGAFVQVLFLALFIGRVPDDSNNQTDS